MAKEVAGKIANLEVELASEREQADGYAASVAQLRKAVSQAEANIKRLKQQVDTVKATESVQKAQMAVAQRYGGSQAKLHTAVESLERIKLKQAERAAVMEATAELAEAVSLDDSLEAKLRAAGIVADSGSADSVLARLKDKAKS
ncbi:PspA/IM30 family protein [compost metagenome]